MGGTKKTSILYSHSKKRKKESGIFGNIKKRHNLQNLSKIGRKNIYHGMSKRSGRKTKPKIESEKKKKVISYEEFQKGLK